MLYQGVNKVAFRHHAGENSRIEKARKKVEESRKKRLQRREEMDEDTTERREKLKQLEDEQKRINSLIDQIKDGRKVG